MPTAPKLDHQEQINLMRKITTSDSIPSVNYHAAAKLLEMHDAGDINLHDIPELLTFVEDKLKILGQHGEKGKVK